MITEKTIKNTLVDIITIGKRLDLDLPIENQIRAVAARWQEADGTDEEFQSFCLKHYVKDPSLKKRLLDKIHDKIEKIYGFSLAIYWSNAWSVTMQTGPVELVDGLFAEMDPTSHILEDFYRSKLAHCILLNFPLLSLDEKRKLTQSKQDRFRLVQSRMAELVMYRIPFEVRTLEAEALSETFRYLDRLIFDLDRIVMSEKAMLMENPMKADCHWGLRDQIVLHYQDPNGFRKQQLLFNIWERVVLEEVPLMYFENPKLRWDPIKNDLFERELRIHQKHPAFYKERYARLGALFKSKKAEDALCVEMPNFIMRSFEQVREISEANVRQLLTDFLTNPLLAKCAKHLQNLLQRPLSPFDVVFNQFELANCSAKSKGNYDDITAEQFPTLSHFKKAIPDLLIRLGFEPKLALKIAKKIKVVACRTGGFSSAPKMKEGLQLLATSMETKEMTYMSFATAMHELGHCVEAYLSSETCDHYLLGEVPSPSFTEAFAFLFDSKSKEMLGIEEQSPGMSPSRILNLFWTAFLNSGIALVDMDCWQWMYTHPNFTEEELKTAVIGISRDIWNRYFSPIIGEKNSVILAGYSPMLMNPLYMPDYALAIFIQTQIEHYLEDKVLGQEMVRMCKTGKATPNEWMKVAVGETISSRVLLELANKILI